MFCARLQTILLPPNRSSFAPRLPPSSFATLCIIRKFNTINLKLPSHPPKGFISDDTSQKFSPPVFRSSCRISSPKFTIRLRHNFSGGASLKNNKPRWLKSQIPEVSSKCWNTELLFMYYVLYTFIFEGCIGRKSSSKCEPRCKVRDSTLWLYGPEEICSHFLCLSRN